MRTTPLARRVIDALPPEVAVSYVADGREVVRPITGATDPFGAGKRQMTIMRRRSPFLMACPAGSSKFACCGYLVLTLASNCPMDCGYCFLQEYLADNPGFQVYANYADAFDELEKLRRNAPTRGFRVGTGELADSLAFDSITGMSRDLVEYFSGRDDLTLELKTKTDEIENLLKIDPKRPHAGFMDAVARAGFSEHGASHGLAGGSNRSGAARARSGLSRGVSSRSNNRVRRGRAGLSRTDRAVVRYDRADADCIRQHGWIAHDAGSQSGCAAALSGRSDAGGRRGAGAGRPLSHLHALAAEALRGAERSDQAVECEVADLSVHGKRERASARVRCARRHRLRLGRAGWRTGELGTDGDRRQMSTRRAGATTGKALTSRGARREAPSQPAIELERA